MIGKTNGLGLTNSSVLVQEYLDGTEYVVDMVSRDGVHKCVAVWQYDRAAMNGASFVCLGQKLLCTDNEVVLPLIAYQRNVLTALGILNGPSHGEVKWCRGEPVLVEVGARCHGAEGLWVPISDSVYGYNQVDIACASYLDSETFEQIPSEVYPLK
jgi:biotin carboxylase